MCKTLSPIHFKSMLSYRFHLPTVIVDIILPEVEWKLPYGCFCLRNKFIYPAGWSEARKVDNTTTGRIHHKTKNILRQQNADLTHLGCFKGSTNINSVHQSSKCVMHQVSELQNTKCLCDPCSMTILLTTYQFLLMMHI